MSHNYTVSDLVADFLDRLNVTAAFGIVSVHNIPMLDAIARKNRIRMITPRGELGASHMADGYGRASGHLGVLFSSTGPGAANAVCGLVEARFASTPLLHLTGQTSTKYVDRGMGTVHDIPDQLGIMSSAGKSAYRIRAASEAFAVLQRAIADAFSFPRGPVTVEIPIDIQRAELERPASLEYYTPPLEQAAPVAESEMDMLVTALLKAKRPMLWLGRGGATAGEPARELLDMGIGMVTSWAGRGVVPDNHPQNFGALNGTGLISVENFYQTVDLMIVAGSRLRGHETIEFSLKLPRNIIQIDIDPAADGRTYGNVGFVTGDAKAVLTELVRRVRGRLTIDKGYTDEVKKLKIATRAAFAKSLGPYETFADQLAKVMPADTIWARDITINHSTWGHRLLPLQDTTANIYPIGAGIGQGMCLGMGAALAANGRKTIAMTGDGGFYLNMGEFWTAIQEKLNMVILVMNDNGYGVIRHIQDKSAGGRRRFDVIDGPDLLKLCEMSNVPFWRVSDPQDFGAAVKDALAVDGLAMVEVDMVAIGDHPPYYPYGAKVENA